MRALLRDELHYDEKNHFAFADEATLSGGHERRPDIVLYLHGIAIGVLELKNMCGVGAACCNGWSETRLPPSASSATGS